MRAVYIYVTAEKEETPEIAVGYYANQTALRMREEELEISLKVWDRFSSPFFVFFF